MEREPKATLTKAEQLAGSTNSFVDKATKRLAEITDFGERIDYYQVSAKLLAQWATYAKAATSLINLSQQVLGSAESGEYYSDMALSFAAQSAQNILAGVTRVPKIFRGMEKDIFQFQDGNLPLLTEGLDEWYLRSIGRRTIEAKGVGDTPLAEAEAEAMRTEVRSFAKKEIAPLARNIHLDDSLVPQELINQIANLGLFSGSIPANYGGTETGYLSMVVLAEELSAASLGVASVATRTEILTSVLLAGGTEEQRQKWLPKLASGEKLVSVAVTEPNAGSDVSAVQCKARRGELEGRPGWIINGSKQWPGYAGRADLILLLARTDPNPDSGSRGLSLFIIEKDRFEGSQFKQEQPGGGSISGEKIPTLGYRGMHTFSLSVDDFFVPDENLVGGEEALNRGHRLILGGFAKSRLHTAGRAVGVSKAALRDVCGYVKEREQFGQKISEYQLTQYEIGEMAIQFEAARQLTYHAACVLNQNFNAAIEPAMAKVLTSETVKSITQRAQLLFGGTGYAQETDISRYVVDALLFPIIEGADPVLKLKVIARNLLEQQK